MGEELIRLFFNCWLGFFSIFSYIDRSSGIVSCFYEDMRGGIIDCFRSWIKSDEGEVLDIWVIIWRIVWIGDVSVNCFERVNFFEWFVIVGVFL